MSTDTMPATGRARSRVRTPEPPRPFFADNPDRGCAPTKVDPDLFFPEETADENIAAAVCGRCPVKDDCGTWAIQTGQQHGVWGGMTSRQLRIAVQRHRDHANTHPDAMIELVAPPVTAPPEPTLDQRVAEMYALERTDISMALTLGVHPSTVRESRNRQHLRPLYGPRGRRIHRTEAAA
jgi:WhiB family redox-sensing transcriptional regulator